MPSTRARRSEGFYFVVVDGVPQYCQWQELKDYLRDSAKVRPGHTNVVKVNEDGTRVGFCPLPNKVEANRAFDYLVAEGWRGLDIRVSLVWKSDLSSEEVERRRGPEQSLRRRVTLTSPVLPYPSNITRTTRLSSLPLLFNGHSVTQGSRSAQYTTSSHPTSAMPATHSYVPYLSDNGLHASQLISGPCQPQITGRQNHHGSWSIQPNLVPYISASGSNSQQHEVEYTDHIDFQSIYISNLPQDTTREELRNLLPSYNRTSDIALKRAKGQRCSAIIRFESLAGALFAFQELDGQSLRNCTLAVQYRRRKEDVASSGPSISSRGSGCDSSTSARPSSQSSPKSGPLIVNGARGPGYYHRRKVDDDSESMDEMSSVDGTRG